MKRLLPQLMLSAVVFLTAAEPAAATQDESWVERQADRAAERAERVAERAERAGERVAQRVERVQERAEERIERAREGIERRVDWQLKSMDGARILIGKDYTLPEGSTASESIIVVGGDATIDGTAENDVLMVGGRLRIGPTAVIQGDVATIGGRLDLDPSARIEGDVNTARIGWPDWSWRGWSDLPDIGGIWWEGAAFAFTIGRFVLVLLLSILLVAVAPRRTGSIAARLSTGPVVSAMAGFAAEIFFAPALILLAVALIITIVGIPLLAGLPFLIAAFGLLWIAGYATVAGVLGARLRGRDWYVGGLRPLDVVVGSLVLSSVSMFGQMLLMSSWPGPFAMLVRGTGWTIEYLAWTIGLGAALTAWMRPRGFGARSAPPVIPPLPTPSPTGF